jgi:hypothetical protein
MDKRSLTERDICTKFSPESVPNDSRSELENISAELLEAIFPTEKAVRPLGVSISGFAHTQIDTPSQIALL